MRRLTILVFFTLVYVFLKVPKSNPVNEPRLRTSMTYSYIFLKIQKILSTEFDCCHIKFDLHLILSLSIVKANVYYLNV